MRPRLPRPHVDSPLTWAHTLPSHLGPRLPAVVLSLDAVACSVARGSGRPCRSSSGFRFSLSLSSLPSPRMSSTWQRGTVRAHTQCLEPDPYGRRSVVPPGPDPVPSPWAQLRVQVPARQSPRSVVAWTLSVAHKAAKKAEKAQPVPPPGPSWDPGTPSVPLGQDTWSAGRSLLGGVILAGCSLQGTKTQPSAHDRGLQHLTVFWEALHSLGAGARGCRGPAVSRRLTQGACPPRLLQGTGFLSQSSHFTIYGRAT